MAGDRGASRLAEPGNDIDHPLRNTGLKHQLPEPKRAELVTALSGPEVGALVSRLKAEGAREPRPD